MLSSAWSCLEKLLPWTNNSIACHFASKESKYKAFLLPSFVQVWISLSRFLGGMIWRWNVYFKLNIDLFWALGTVILWFWYFLSKKRLIYIYIYYSYDQDILIQGIICVFLHWIRDACLSYFWELLFLTSKSTGICVAMARVPVGQGSQEGLELWLTGWLTFRGASENPKRVLRQRGLDWPRGPTHSQLPTAIRECGCSQRIKLQTVRHRLSWYILMLKESTVCITIFSVVTVHNFGFYFQVACPWTNDWKDWVASKKWSKYRRQASGWFLSQIGWKQYCLAWLT